MALLCRLFRFLEHTEVFLIFAKNEFYFIKLEDIAKFVKSRKFKNSYNSDFRSMTVAD